MLVVFLAVTSCDGESLSSAEKKLARPANLPEVPVAARPGRLVASPAGTLGGETTGSLAGLLEVGARFGRAMAAYRAGQDPAAALAPIGFKATDHVRLDLERAGAAYVTHLGFELELLFFERGRGRYYVRTLVHAGADGVSFLRVQGKNQPDGDLRVRGRPFEDWSGAGEPFQAAGRALLERLRSRDCERLPLVSFSRLRALISDDVARQRFDRELEQAQAQLPTICQEVATLSHAEVELRVDDHLYLARAADGAVLGIVRGNLEQDEEGSITLVLGPYRTLK